MSRIDDLIAELCPDGVPLKAINDFASFQKGKTITKADACLEGEVPVVSGGRSAAYFHNESNRTGQTIAIAGSGANAGFVSYWEIPIFVSDAFTLDPDPDVMTPRYLYHLMRQNQDEIHGLQKAGGIPHVYGKDVVKLQVFVPPLEVQHEIVRILDAFTELESELESELEARKKQYEYYRDELLTFSDDEVQWVPLGNLFIIRNGYTPSKSNNLYWESGEIPWFRIDDIRLNGRRLESALQSVAHAALKDSGPFPAGSILLSTSATVGEFAYITVPHLANQRFISLQLSQDFSSKVADEFLPVIGQILSSFAKQNATDAGNFPSISTKVLKNFVVPVPDIANQKEIARKLELFDALVNDISTGLPAEIDARRKQYEHYRDRLLTFSEVSG